MQGNGVGSAVRDEVPPVHANGMRVAILYESASCFVQPNADPATKRDNAEEDFQLLNMNST